MEAPVEPKKGSHLPLQTLLALLFAVAVAIGLSASAVLRKRCGTRKELDDGEVEGAGSGGSGGFGFLGEREGRRLSGWGAVKEAVMGSFKWSCSRKLGVSGGGSWEGETAAAAPLELPTRVRGAWDSRVEAAPSPPLLQRRILMGERCELRRFSGLILYDEKGFPLLMNTAAAAAARASHSSQQDKPVMVVTTLKDLL